MMVRFLIRHMIEIVNDEVFIIVNDEVFIDGYDQKLIERDLMFVNYLIDDIEFEVK